MESACIFADHALSASMVVIWPALLNLGHSAPSSTDTFSIGNLIWRFSVGSKVGDIAWLTSSVVRAAKLPGWTDLV
jgi:hypothetical protein